MLRFYNSLTRKKEEFKPLVPGQVGMYTCGPTVYDFPHIGNMRAYITWDILKRLLTAHGYTVKHIMNVTDVGHLTSDADTGDDKMELARKRERVSAYEIADKYLATFKGYLQELNILPPNKYVRATDHINDMIAFVKTLDEKGYLYKTSDGLYFDTSKDPEYGRLGTIKAKGLRPGARIEVSPEKRHSTDFAVWKFSPKEVQREMEWDSPWGTGFPGWHLECSVISMKYLGETFDIHTGGIDHRTIHHPNEMAQSKAVSGKLQARYWLHNNFMTHKDKKMAKSAGTFVRLDDLIVGGVRPLSYRFYVMQTHYRKEISYSWEAIKAAEQGLKNLYREIGFFRQPARSCTEYEEKFMKAIDDDLNTAKALDVMQGMLTSAKPSGSRLSCVLAMDRVLGLRIQEEWERRQTLPEEAKEVLRKRAEARKQKNWQLSDALRARLVTLGVEVKDTKEGQVAALSE